VMVRDADDPRPVIAQGAWEGTIGRTPRGSGGFGYDPVFIPAGSGLTAAEMTAETKNAVSHRAQALGVLLAHLIVTSSNK
jgi:XTP/dITP diphosphohydrolase